MSLATRNMIEVAQRWAGLAEQQAQGYKFAGERGIDIGSLPILAQKAYPGARDVDVIHIAMAHCTGVTAGYGVQRWGKTGWRHWLPKVQATKRLVGIDGEFDATTYLTHPKPGSLLPFELAIQLWESGILDEPALRVAKLVALLSRYRNTPYHVIATRGGYVVYNRRIDECTWHGQGTRTSGGNQGLGVAFDASPKSSLTQDFLLTCQAAVRTTHLLWLEQQRESNPELVIVTHAQAKYPGRANDPGGALYWGAVVPAVNQIAAEGHRVRVDLSWHYKTGRPFPKWAMKAA